MKHLEFPPLGEVAEMALSAATRVGEIVCKPLSLDLIAVEDDGSEYYSDVICQS